MIDLSAWAEAIENAPAEQCHCIVASANRDGYPDAAPKGSMMVFDKEHLAWWERARGEQLAQIEENPWVAVYYRNAARKLMVRFYGEATIYSDGPIRDQVMARTPQIELDADPERKGVAVVLRIDRVRVSRNTVQQREAVS